MTCLTKTKRMLTVWAKSVGRWLVVEIKTLNYIQLGENTKLCEFMVWKVGAVRKCVRPNLQISVLYSSVTRSFWFGRWKQSPSHSFFILRSQSLLLWFQLTWSARHVLQLTRKWQAWSFFDRSNSSNLISNFGSTIYLQSIYSTAWQLWVIEAFFCFALRHLM